MEFSEWDELYSVLDAIMRTGTCDMGQSKHRHCWRRWAFRVDRGEQREVQSPLNVLITEQKEPKG